MGPEATGGGGWAGADWASAMQKAQADLLRQWSELSAAWTQAATPTTGGRGPSSTSGAPEPGATTAPAGTAADDLARGFLRQCEQYLGVSRSLWDLVGRAAASSDPQQRTRQFNEGLGALQQQFASLWAATPFGAPGASANPFGLSPATGFAPGLGLPAGMGFPGMSPGMTGFGGLGALGGLSTGLGPGAGFAMPALGLTRESQESFQRLGQLAARCWQAQLQVSGQWNDIIGRALRELGERLGPRLKGGAPPGSMKEVYDLWVESAESVYAQSARSAAFVQAQADLTNALSQLRSAQRELLEEWARQFDLPTRAELNSIHQQLRDLKAALQR